MNKFVPAVVIVALGVLALVSCDVALAADSSNVPNLVKQLKDKDAVARRTAAKALADLGPEAKEAAPALVEAMKDSDVFVRRFAAQALGNIGPEAAKLAVPALAKAIKDEKENEVLEPAILALGKLGPSAVPALTDSLKSKDPYIQYLAARAVAGIGPDAKAAVPALIDVLKAGGNMKKKDAKPEHNPLPPAVEALGNIGPAAKDALPALQTLLDAKNNKDKDFRKQVNQTIAKIEGKKK